MRQNCVKNASKMRGTPLGENTFWTRCDFSHARKGKWPLSRVLTFGDVGRLKFIQYRTGVRKCHRSLKFLQTPPPVLDRISGPKGAESLSSTGLGLDNLIERAQFSPEPALDKNRSPRCELSGPVLRDTARLSQRYPPIARYGVFGVSTWPIGCDIPSPFSERFPLGVHAKWRCDTPPSKGVSQRYFRDTTWKQGKLVRYPPVRYYLERVLCDMGVSRTGPLRMLVPRYPPPISHNTLKTVTSLNKEARLLKVHFSLAIRVFGDNELKCSRCYERKAKIAIGTSKYCNR